MLYHVLIRHENGVISPLDLEMPFSAIENDGFIGIPGYPLKSYTFAEPVGSGINKKFRLPTITIDSEIHVGHKNDKLEDRIIWLVIDLDEKQLLLRRIDGIITK